MDIATYGKLLHGSISNSAILSPANADLAAQACHQAGGSP
jgi:hypothetical protein